MRFFFTFLFIAFLNTSVVHAQVPNAIGLGCQAWSIQNVDVSANDVGKYNSIAASDANNIFISYYDETAQTIKVAMSMLPILSETILWDISTPDSSGNNVGRYNDISVTNNSNIYLSYYDTTDQDLIVNFTQNRGVNWTRTVVDSTGDVGKYNSIETIDVSLNPDKDEDIAYISYIDSTNRTLKSATNYSTIYTYPLDPAFGYTSIKISTGADIMDRGASISILDTAYKPFLLPIMHAAYNFTNGSVSLFKTKRLLFTSPFPYDTYTTLPHLSSGNTDLGLNVNILNDFQVITQQDASYSGIVRKQTPLAFVSYIHNDTDLNFAKLNQNATETFSTSYSLVTVEENIEPSSIAHFNAKKEDKDFTISYINYTGSLSLAESRTHENPRTVGNSFTTEIIQLADQSVLKASDYTDIVVVDSNTILISFYDNINKNLKIARSLCK